MCFYVSGVSTASGLLVTVAGTFSLQTIETSTWKNNNIPHKTLKNNSSSRSYESGRQGPEAHEKTNNSNSNILLYGTNGEDCQ